MFTKGWGSLSESSMSGKHCIKIACLLPTLWLLLFLFCSVNTTVIKKLWCNTFPVSLESLHHLIHFQVFSYHFLSGLNSGFTKHYIIHIVKHSSQCITFPCLHIYLPYNWGTLVGINSKRDNLLVHTECPLNNFFKEILTTPPTSISFILLFLRALLEHFLFLKLQSPRRLTPEYLQIFTGLNISFPNLMIWKLWLNVYHFHFL